MVQVIPVHNFQEQNVAQIEEPQASCVASVNQREFLLLASATHCVEVRDLGQPDIPLVTSFPTVDLPSHLVHCVKGNYVATLETKQFSPQQQQQRQINDLASYIRIYINWDSQEQQSMRARIAGRVTPSLNRPLNGLEMIELPLSAKPTAIACCQTTGNILVATGNTLILHEFKVEIQNPSKLKFIDFDARPWSLGLHFSPTRLQIVENFVAAMDNTRFVVFKLTNPLYDDIDHLSSLTSTASSNDKTTISTDFCSIETGDNSLPGLGSNESSLSKLRSQSNVKECFDKNSNPHCFFNSGTNKNKKNACIDWNRLITDEKAELESLISKGIINENSQSFSIDLPSITLERAGPGHTLNPFVLNSTDTEVFIKTNSPDNGWSENYVVKTVLRLRIARSNDYSRADRNGELFTSFVLKPLYMKTNRNNNRLKKSIVKSDNYKYFHGVTCLICTTQEGYIYHFNTENNQESNPICLTTYQFTAPVIHIALEYTVLHALTEAGLESYTLRLPHHITKLRSQTNNLDSICPEITEPVCLIGLRPFLGVQQLINSDKIIVLLAKAESSWTIYSLRLPRPENVYFDIVNAAKNHRTVSPSLYRHLLEEAHTMLRLSKEIIDLLENDNDYLKMDPKLESLYNQSCALLGDYFIGSETELEWQLCIPYYQMSTLKPSEVLSRKSSQNAAGLVIYVTEILKNICSGPEADALFQAQDIINIISSKSREDLLKIVLESTVLREYATDKLIKLLESHNEDDSVRLTLTLLYIHAEKQAIAEAVLDKVSNKFLLRKLMDHPRLIFDEGSFDSKNRVVLSFSEFARTLLSKKSWVFAKTLTKLIEENFLSLHQVMQVFLEYLPVRVGKDGHDAAVALQQFLETYLHTHFFNLENKNNMSYDFALVEAFKILVRSYLSKLMQSGSIKTEVPTAKIENECFDEDFLFQNQRPKYLDKMPPFAKDYQKIINAADMEEFSRLNNAENEKVIPIEVMKLQGLMASEFLPGECLQEVEQFLNAKEIVGSLSFLTLCNRNTEMNTQILMDKCPQAVLQFARDMFTKEAEWKLLVDLLQQKISNDNSSQDIQLFFKQTMIETLKSAAEVLPLKSLNNIIPKENEENFQLYTEVCGHVLHAEHVKLLLMETGRQLLSTLNL